MNPLKTSRNVTAEGQFRHHLTPAVLACHRVSSAGAAQPMGAYF